jgi:hypothetical protein
MSGKPPHYRRISHDLHRRCVRACRDQADQLSEADKWILTVVAAGWLGGASVTKQDFDAAKAILARITPPERIEPTADDIGRAVIYHDPSGRKREVGRVHSFNEQFVFVLYGEGDTPAATRRDHLKWQED